MNALGKAAATAALVAFAGCCTQPADATVRPVAMLPSARLSAYYAQLDPGSFRADLSVEAGSCTALRSDATAEVSGVSLDPDTGPACACEGARFSLYGAPIPGATDGTFRVADGTGDMVATVPDLFVEPTVALRPPATALTAGTRVYLDFLPANGTLTDVTVVFLPVGAYTGYTFRSSDGTLGHDAEGYYLDVPDVPAADGDLAAYTYARLDTSACTGAAACEVSASATRYLATSIVRP